VFRGSQKAPYTLVVFSDYECPFCRALYSQLPQTLKNYSGRLRLEIRNLPLTNIHPNALTAARLAETAKLQGRFWPIHDYLMREPLSKATLEFTDLHFGLDPRLSANADHRVQQDVMIAKLLNVRQVPTLFLCCPDNNVVRLKSLADLAVYM